MNLSRRDLLRFGASSLLASDAGVPLFLARTAQAVAAGPPTRARGRILVVVQLGGGNDGLNTVVPYKDDDYKKARPTLQIGEKAVLKIDGQKKGRRAQARPLPDMVPSSQVSSPVTVRSPGPVNVPPPYNCVNWV